MNNKITLSQLCGIFFQVMLASGMGILSYISINGVKQDAWLTIIIAGILGIIPLFLYLYILNYNHNMNFFELSDSLFGNKIGKIISFLIITTIAIYIILYFYNMCKFIAIHYLNKTPNIFISLIFLLPMLYLTSQDLQVIGRSLFIIFIFAIILHFFSFVGLINQVNIDNIKPIFTNSFNNIFDTALRILPFSGLCNILLLGIRKNDITYNRHLNKKIVITYILAFIVMLSVIFFVISVLGIKLCTLYQFPEFNALKRISISRFIERAESTLSIHWIFYVFSTIIFCFYFVKQYIKYTYKIRKFKNLNITVSIIVIITVILSTFAFENLATANYVISNIIPRIIYTLNLGIVILVFIKIKIKNKLS